MQQSGLVRLEDRWPEAVVNRKINPGFFCIRESHKDTPCSNHFWVASCPRVPPPPRGQTLTSHIFPCPNLELHSPAPPSKPTWGEALGKRVAAIAEQLPVGRRDLEDFQNLKSARGKAEGRRSSCCSFTFSTDRTQAKQPLSSSLQLTDHYSFPRTRLPPVYPAY